MKQVLKSGLMITLSLITLAGCNGSFPLTTSNVVDSSYSVASTDASVTNALASTTTTQQNKVRPEKGDKKGGAPHGDKGGPGGKGGFGVFGFLGQLNLTAEQKTQLDAILQANKPAQPDQTKMEAQKTAMEALRKEIDAAFVSDTFDVTALKAKMDALRPVKDDSARFSQEASVIVKVYALLTDEQKKTIETKLAEFAPKARTDRPVEARPAKDDGRFDKLATDLGLTDAQKTALKEAMQPPTDIVKPDPQTMFDKMKATQESILAELKGSASVDKIAEILKSNAPEKVEAKHGNELDRLAKIHSILNADQRAKFIANAPKSPKGHEGKGDPQGGGKGRGH